MALTLGSLFTGIGGIDLAFEWAGFEIAWQVEIDGYCNRVLERHWPDVPRYRDVRGVTGRHGKGWCNYQHLEPVDVIAGGFPCQDISIAGRGDGLDGQRSGLWWEMWRIIRDLKPRAVLLENVTAITATGRGGDEVTASLAALGYDLSWGIISAADTGAPHLRERWWCIGFLADATSDNRDTNSKYERGGWPAVNGCSASEQVVNAPSMGNTDRTGRQKQCRVESVSKKQSTFEYPGGDCPEQDRAAQPRMGGDPDGVSDWLDRHGMIWRGWPALPDQPQYDWEPPRVVMPGEIRNRAKRLQVLGNAVVPQVVYLLAVEIGAALGRCIAVEKAA